MGLGFLVFGLGVWVSGIEKRFLLLGDWVWDYGFLQKTNNFMKNLQKSAKSVYKVGCK